MIGKLSPLPLLSAASILLSACASPHMVPPSEVAQGAVLEAKNRSSMSGALANEDFDLGPYKVAKVERSWVHGKGHAVGAYSSNRSNATYSYELQGGSQSWKGTCALVKDEKNVKMGGGMSFGGSKAGLTCECGSGKLELTRSRSDKFEGTFTPAGQSYTVAPVSETDKKYWGADPVGFRFDGTDGARGAVETLRPGRIWFTEKMAEAEREPGTCLLAGLMLYSEPRDKD
jgi:hypothetical protein